MKKSIVNSFINSLLFIVIRVRTHDGRSEYHMKILKSPRCLLTSVLSERIFDAAANAGNLSARVDGLFEIKFAVLPFTRARVYVALRRVLCDGVVMEIF